MYNRRASKYSVVSCGNHPSTVAFQYLSPSSPAVVSLLLVRVVSERARLSSGPLIATVPRHAAGIPVRRILHIFVRWRSATFVALRVAIPQVAVSLSAYRWACWVLLL